MSGPSEVPPQVAAGSVLLLSGPNLNLLGEREPEIYGDESLADHVATATRAAASQELSLSHVQSNHEGELVDAVHAARGTHDAVVINGGAFTHYSWALHDALAAFPGPVVELHLSNPSSREPWRQTSVLTPVADAVVCGLGGFGYHLAVQGAAELVRRRATGG